MDILCVAAEEAESMTWSSSLLRLLLDELYVDDLFADLMGQPPASLSTGQYPQAIAVALLLRHSWRPDDLASFAGRLRLSRTVRFASGRRPSW